MRTLFIAAMVGALGACTAEVSVGPPADLSMAPPTEMGPRDMAMMICSPACASPTAFCNPNHHCVGCLGDTDCPMGSICQVTGLDARCVKGCHADDRCGAGLKCCAGACLDVTANRNNCGACGTVCAVPHATASCSGARCGVGVCDPGYADCNADPADGCEVPVRVDAANCGACNTTCSFPHGVAGCADGCYLTGCAQGYDDCDGSDKNGCEVATDADIQNCGGCGMRCPNPNHARGTCKNAACGLVCDNLWGDCNNAANDGCERSLTADANNCGACGNVCPQGLICVNGGCTCPQCNLAHASSKCVNNQCVFDKCNPGFGDCDNNPNNGCEVDLSADPKNCGACAMVCPNNLPICGGGVCNNQGCSMTAKFSMQVVAGVWACATDHVIPTYAESNALCSQGYTPATFKLVQGLTMPTLQQHQAYSAWYQQMAPNNAGYIRTGQKRRGGCTPEAHGDIYVANGDQGQTSPSGGWRDLWNGGSSCNLGTDAANNMAHQLAGVICVVGAYELPAP